MPAAAGEVQGDGILQKVNKRHPIRQIPVPPLLESNVEAEDPATRVKGEFSGIAEDRDNNENIAPEGANDFERACVATPSHIGVVESDEDMDSPVTPKLAEWEISEVGM